MDKMNKKRHRYVYLQWTKRERENIDTFIYNGQNGQEKTEILLITMDKTGKRRHILLLTMDKTAREDIYTCTYHGQNG
jgi:hypothetical protein